MTRLRQGNRTSAKSKRRSRKKSHANIPALRKKFSREEQEAWGLALSREAKAIIRAKFSDASRKDEPSNPPYRIPASQLNHLIGRTLISAEQLNKFDATKEQKNKIRAALDAIGRKPGPKTDPKTNQRMIGILTELVRGERLKSTVQDYTPARERAQSAKLWRWCKDFYVLASMFQQTRTIISPAMRRNRKTASSLGVTMRWTQFNLWKDPYVKKVFKEQYGFKLPANLLAAKEAYKRGLNYYRRRPHKRDVNVADVAAKCRVCHKPLSPRSLELCEKHLVEARAQYKNYPPLLAKTQVN